MIIFYIIVTLVIILSCSPWCVTFCFSEKDIPDNLSQRQRERQREILFFFLFHDDIFMVLILYHFHESQQWSIFFYPAKKKSNSIYIYFLFPCLYLYADCIPWHCIVGNIRCSQYKKTLHDSGRNNDRISASPFLFGLELLLLTMDGTMTVPLCSDATTWYICCTDHPTSRA